MEYWPNDLYRCRDNRTVSDDLTLARKVRRNYLALAEISGYGRAEIRLLDFGGRGTNAEYMSWPQSFAAAASMGRGTIVFAARYRICECAQQVRDRAERRKNEPAGWADNAQYMVSKGMPLIPLLLVAAIATELARGLSVRSKNITFSE
jgi:hypothetical protein